MQYQVSKYYGERVSARRASVAKSLREVVKVVQDVLKEVEAQEPRVISSLTEVNGRFEGLYVTSPTEFEVVLYLNQMGEFNFVDDGSIPGSAVLKLSDGRKRSMSLWVEFITASGYLSARKMRSRLHTIVTQAVEKCSGDVVRMVGDTTEVRIRLRDRFTVLITPAFKCSGVWPRSAAHWPSMHAPWPPPTLIAEVKTEGFDLLSKESSAVGNKSAGGLEGDAWVLSFLDAENRLMYGGSRRRTLAILKTLRDRHLDLPGDPVPLYVLKTLVMYECEKHPREAEWEEAALGDRLVGIMLQLITCLQCRRCPHYFLPAINLVRGTSPVALDTAAKQAWRLTRELLTNSKSLEKL